MMMQKWSSLKYYGHNFWVRMVITLLLSSSLFTYQQIYICFGRFSLSLEWLFGKWEKFFLLYTGFSLSHSLLSWEQGKQIQRITFSCRIFNEKIN
jgi:hypothetical protein